MFIDNNIRSEQHIIKIHNVGKDLHALSMHGLCYLYFDGRMNKWDSEDEMRQRGLFAQTANIVSSPLA